MYIRAGHISVPGSTLYTLGDAVPSSREADQRFQRVAALVTGGIKTAKDAIPQLKDPGARTIALHDVFVGDQFLSAWIRPHRRPG